MEISALRPGLQDLAFCRRMLQSRKLLKNEEKELEEQKVGIAEGVVSLHNLIVIPRFHLAVSSGSAIF